MSNLSKIKLNLAIIGLGNWGKKLLFEFKKSSNVKYCCTTGRSKNLKWLKKNFPEVQFSKNIDEILSDNQLDAVVIATPINSHEEIAKKALFHKKHVFVEKPMAENNNASKSLISLAKKQKCHLFVGNIFLYHPVFHKLKIILRNEKIQSISGVWLKTGTFNESIILNLLYHDLSILYGLIGKPTKINIDNSQKFITDCDILNAKVSFSKKIYCHFHINRISKIKHKSITIVTEKNCYLWENDDLFKFSKKTSKFTKYHVSTQTALENECKQFISEISKQPNNFENAKKSSEILKALCTVS